MAEQEKRGWTEIGIVPGVNRWDKMAEQPPLIAGYWEIVPGKKAVGYIPDISWVGGQVKINNKIEVWPGSLAVRALMEVGLVAAIGSDKTGLFIPQFVRVENWGLPGQMIPDVVYWLEARILDQQADRVTMAGSIFSIYPELISPTSQIVFDIIKGG